MHSLFFPNCVISSTVSACWGTWKEHDCTVCSIYVHLLYVCVTLLPELTCASPYRSKTKPKMLSLKPHTSTKGPKMTRCFTVLFLTPVIYIIRPCRGCDNLVTDSRSCAERVEDFDPKDKGWAFNLWHHIWSWLSLTCQKSTWDHWGQCKKMLETSKHPTLTWLKLMRPKMKKKNKKELWRIESSLHNMTIKHFNLSSGLHEHLSMLHWN